MSANSVLIPLHLSPDPDSMASAIASAKILSGRGKDVCVVSADPIPDLPLLRSQWDIETIDPADVDQSAYDLFLAQDISSLDRFSLQKDFDISPTTVTVNIDHHKTNTMFAEYNYVDLEASSTSEILYQLYSEHEVSIDPALATVLYYGMVADNGWFAFGPEPKTYEIAQSLAELGADPRSISTDMQHTTLADIKILGRMYEHLNVDTEQNFAFSYLTLQDIAECGLEGKPFQSGSHIMKFLPDIDFGVVAVEKEPGQYKLSFRTREAHAFDVAAVAQRLGGGGHVMAAGALVEAESPRGARDQIVGALIKLEEMIEN